MKRFIASLLVFFSLSGLTASSLLAEDTGDKTDKAEDEPTEQETKEGELEPGT